MQSSKHQRLLAEAAGLIQAGRFAPAARLCTQARTMAPRDFTAWFYSGVLALQQDDLESAATWLATAHRLDPRHGACALRLGFALARLGRHAEAEAPLQAAVTAAPTDGEAWDTYGYVLKSLNRLEAALAAHRRAVALQPGRAHSWYNLGHALLYAGRPAEALLAHERAVAVQPDFVNAQCGRAMALQTCHRIPEAVAAYGEVLARMPAHHEARSYRLMSLNYLDGLSREDVFREHLAFGEAMGEVPARAFANSPEPARRLRVAFISPDLRTHSVAYFLEPLLANLDPEQFEIVLYHDHFVEDATSARLRTRATVWRNFANRDAAHVEATIRADAPDVLVDLAGHTGLNRLPLFARRLAPVQISYLGYPNTSGLRAMDYRLVDSITDPVGEVDSFCTEKLVRFAPTAWSYAPPAEVPAPARVADGQITFGCFNNLAKVSDSALAAWARLLVAVPGAILKLKAIGLGEPSIAAHFNERLARAGLDRSRVHLLERTPGIAEHLALYQQIDVALDTFPYHGTTTTCEALWMGVPVVTLAGDRHASRVSASLLAAVGRPEWIARDWDDYISIAAELTRSPASTAEHRSALREAMRASVLLDHAGQAGRFGSALRECWAAWCSRAAAAA